MHIQISYDNGAMKLKTPEGDKLFVKSVFLASWILNTPRTWLRLDRLFYDNTNANRHVRLCKIDNLLTLEQNKNRFLEQTPLEADYLNSV